MKMSLRLMIYRRVNPSGRRPPLRTAIRTFSWRRCFSSFSSRYVRFESTGELKGLTIFLTATAEPVN